MHLYLSVVYDIPLRHGLHIFAFPLIHILSFFSFVLVLFPAGPHYTCFGK